MLFLIASKPCLSIKLISIEGLLQSCELSLNPSGFQLSWDDDQLPPNLLEQIQRFLLAYAEKKEPSERPPLDHTHFPPFTHSVLSHLSTIPFGKTTTYGDIAAKLGKEKGARAVGNACGSNPFPLLIPCHRVLAKGNLLGGFSCGIEIKKELLDFEGIAISPNKTTLKAMEHAKKGKTIKAKNFDDICDLVGI